jgi:ubiquinone/menaquinone biosynthesis C-methylase UbiE
MRKDSMNQKLFEYYDERAPEYEAFYYGKFPTPHPDPDIYNNDRLPIQSLVADYIKGKCVDIACGTGFWLPFYHRNCSSVTLIDQSESMLAECTKKIHNLGIESKASVVRSNIFNPALAGNVYDSAVIGFLISHLNDAELADFFGTLKSFLKPGGTFVIIDSLWSEEIKASRLVKAGMNKRMLFDGREFEIFKRFFDKDELRELSEKYVIDPDIIYWGKVFFLTVGKFK